MILNNIDNTTRLTNGIEMPVLGLGVYKTLHGKETENAVITAFENGYRLIDTASYYQNEKSVGVAVKASGIPREKIFITTKVWNTDQGIDRTLKAFEVSLSKLQMEYVDMYMIHWPVPDLYIDSWKTLIQLYETGKTKAIGVCNCMPHHIETLVKETGVKPMALQSEFHPRLVQQDVLDYCKQNNIQFQSWSPLMRGQILGHEFLQQIAGNYNKTVAQVIIRWNLQKGICTIPKSIHPERIAENADVFDFELSSDEIKSIDALHTNERTGAHPDHFMEHFAKKENAK